MKKEVIHFVQCALVKILFFGAGYPLHAQVSNPSSWESFVGSSDNTLVSDTFRLQTFGDSEWDNWEYLTTPNVTIVLNTTDNSMTAKLPVGDSLFFSSFSTKHYQGTKIEVKIAGNHLMPTETLSFISGQPDGSANNLVYSPDNTDDFFNYKTETVTGNPSSICMATAPKASQTMDGYYMTNQVWAFGDIPSYSLFSGTGNWNDTTLWSHLPPLRHRSALIKGDVSITADTYCNTAAISSGNLQINPGTRFLANHLELFEAGASIQSGGAIAISDCITVHKTFEETGKWYFISFPFDVYPAGIDSRFTQKDGTPNDGGNYLYVQCYNGDKRASANQSSGNWEVVPVRSGNIPVFEKNKGYLIALDKNAADKTLSFSSRPGDIPEDFANTGTLRIPMTTGMTPENRENHGWYLCGNPLPAPLPLSQIEKNAALDGYVYVYNGSGYKAYSLNSNHALPPFSAFFVKASSETDINVSSDLSAQTTNMIRTNHPLSLYNAEPVPDRQSTGLISGEASNIHYFIKDRQLYLQNIPEPGYIKIANMQGKYILQRKSKGGDMIIPLTDQSGMYILQININNSVKAYKFCLP